MHSGESEMWAAVPGYDYEVSTKGRVRSLKTGRVQKAKPRINGYVSAMLQSDDGEKRFYVHRLVVSAFIRAMAEGEVVNHINFIRHDNRLENLEIVDMRQNAKHSKDAGRYAGNRFNAPRGDKSPCAKLNSLKVRAIRELRDSGATLTQIGSQYGITKTHVSNIVRRLSWADV